MQQQQNKMAIGACCVLAGLLSFGLVQTTPAASAASPADDCKLSSEAAPNGRVATGFPNRGHIPAVGDLRVVVAFVEFPDYPGPMDIAAARAHTLFGLQEYFEAQSYGRTLISLESSASWIPAAGELAAYYDPTREMDGDSASRLAFEAGAALDDSVDFSDVDALWVVTSVPIGSLAFPIRAGGQRLIVDGKELLAGTLTGVDFRPFDPAPPLGINSALVHESLHNMGLPDLYDTEPGTGTNRFVGAFDPMGAVTGEMLAWNRWQLGWLDDQQIACVGTAPATFQLAPISAGGETSAIVYRADAAASTAIAIEYRPRVGYDGDRANDGIDRDGVLIYEVDSAIETGAGPIRVLSGEPDDSFPSGSALIEDGDDFVHGGLRIQVGPLQDGLMNVTLSQPCAGPALLDECCAGQIVSIDMNAGALGIGTAGDDVILGTPRADVIHGLGGNDTVCAGAGDDTVVGGDGHDVLFGGDGSDVMRGNAGVDRLEGEGGPDRLLGGIDGDMLNGGEGDDFLGGFGGNDTINGGPGDEVIFGGFGGDTIDGGPGDDEIHGLIGDDVIDGGGGNDRIDGDRGNDTINGGPGDDVIRGGNAADVLNGGGGNDSVSGGRADDQLAGGGGTSDTCVGNKQIVADTADATCEVIFGVP